MDRSENLLIADLRRDRLERPLHDLPPELLFLRRIHIRMADHVWDARPGDDPVGPYVPRDGAERGDEGRGQSRPLNLFCDR